MSPIEGKTKIDLNAGHISPPVKGRKDASDDKHSLLRDVPFERVIVKIVPFHLQNQQ